MANTTTTEVSHAVNNYYDRSLLKASRPLLLHTKWAQVRDIPRNNTNIIKFRKYTLLTANTTALTEGVTPSGTQLAVSDITATVAQYGDYVTLTDKLQFTTLDPLLTETADLLGQQAGNSIDQLTRDVLAAGTTEQFASTATSTATISASMKITADEVREAVRTLQGNNARPITRMVNPSTGFNTSPVMPCYISIIHPNTHFDLKKVTGWVPVSQYSDKSDIMEGEVGSLDEVRFIMTTNAKTKTGTLVSTVHRTIILASDAYGISRISGEAMKNIVKPLGSGGTADPLDQRSTSGWKATFIAKIIDETYMIGIEHAVSS